MNNRERSQLTEYISAKRNRTVSEVLRVKAMTEVILLCAYIHNLHFGENFVAAMRNAVAHHTLVLSAHSFGFHLNLVFSCAKKKVPNFVSAHHTLILFSALFWLPLDLLSFCLSVCPSVRLHFCVSVTYAFVYVCACVPIHICTYTHTQTHTHTHTHTHTQTHIHTHTHASMHTHICTKISRMFGVYPKPQPKTVRRIFSGGWGVEGAEPRARDPIKKPKP